MQPLALRSILVVAEAADQAFLSVEPVTKVDGR